jgi:hypothetical protein
VGLTCTPQSGFNTHYSIQSWVLIHIIVYRVGVECTLVPVPRHRAPVEALLLQVVHDIEVVHGVQGQHLRNIEEGLIGVRNTEREGFIGERDIEEGLIGLHDIEEGLIGVRDIEEDLIGERDIEEG